MAERGERYFPSECLLRLLADGGLKDHYQIPPEHCWALAAAEMNIVHRQHGELAFKLFLGQRHHGPISRYRPVFFAAQH